MRRTILLVAAMALILLAASGVALAVNKIGTDGPDTLRGSNGSDNIVSNAGNDFVSNPAGASRPRDKFSAGDGNDVIVIDNDPAARDLVSCGDGIDWVSADKKDAVAADCENVADTAAEREQLQHDIPQSFWAGLPPFPSYSGFQCS